MTGDDVDGQMAAWRKEDQGKPADDVDGQMAAWRKEDQGKPAQAAPDPVAAMQAAALVSANVSPEAAAQSKATGIESYMAKHIDPQRPETPPAYDSFYADPINAAIARGDEKHLNKMAGDVDRTVLENRAK